MWEERTCNELGRLEQGCKSVVGRNTIFFASKSKNSKYKCIACARIVCAMCPQKTETHRVWLTIGVNLTQTTGITSTPVSNIETIKCHWKSFLHNNSRYCTIEIKDFCLNSQLREYVCVRLLVSVIPKAIMDQHNLHDMACDRWICIEACGGMHSHPEAGRLACDQIVQHL